MTELRLHKGSDEILERWWLSDKPKEGDQQLIREVLDTVRNNTWHRRWRYTRDIADDPSIAPRISIWPRDFLVVAVRIWSDEEESVVELINIFETDVPGPGPDYPDDG